MVDIIRSTVTQSHRPPPLPTPDIGTRGAAALPLVFFRCVMPRSLGTRDGLAEIKRSRSEVAVEDGNCRNDRAGYIRGTNSLTHDF